MSGIPSPGWPVIALGRKIYHEVHGQSMDGFGASWWYNWFATIGATSAFRQWRDAKRAANPFDVQLLAATLLNARGALLVEAENEQPSAQQPAADYNVLALSTTGSGWSVWRGGQYDVPLDDSDWMRITGRYLSWVISQIAHRTLGTRALDIALEYMVLPSPAQRRFPLLRPPAGLAKDPVAQDGWALWWKESGGGEPMGLFSQSSARQWTALDAETKRLTDRLGNIHTVLRYASLTEPLYRLQEKLNEFDNKRQSLNASFKTLADNREVAERVLTRAELQAWDETERAVRDEEMRLYRSLPPGVWDGPAPTDMAGLGAWLLTGAITGIVATGLIASVAWAIAALDVAMARQRAMGQLNKVIGGLEEDARQAELIRQECLLSAEQEPNDTKRRTLAAQCNRDAQKTLTAIAAARTDAASAVTAAAANRPQNRTENTGLYVIGAVAALGAYAWWQHR